MGIRERMRGITESVILATGLLGASSEVGAVSYDGKKNGVIVKNENDNEYKDLWTGSPELLERRKEFLSLASNFERKTGIKILPKIDIYQKDPLLKYEHRSALLFLYFLRAFNLIESNKSEAFEFADILESFAGGTGRWVDNAGNRWAVLKGNNFSYTASKDWSTALMGECEFMVGGSASQKWIFPNPKEPNEAIVVCCSGKK